MPRGSLVIVTLIVVPATVFLITASPSFQIAYHRYGLARTEARLVEEAKRAKAQGIGLYGNQDIIDRQQWHLERLAALGYFFHETYQMENIRNNKNVHRAFCQLVFDFTDTRHVSVAYPDNSLEVWDLAGRKSSWDAFAAKYNVVDFATLYGQPAVQGNE